VYEAKQYVQQQACGRTKQALGNIDGCNPEERQLGYGLRPHPSHIFEMALTRCTQAAQTLL